MKKLLAVMLMTGFWSMALMWIVSAGAAPAAHHAAAGPGSVETVALCSQRSGLGDLVQTALSKAGVSHLIPGATPAPGATCIEGIEAGA